MSELINDLNIPEPIFEIFKNRNNEYDYNDDPYVYSATDLLNPIKQIILKKRYSEHLQDYLSTSLDAIYGTAVHEYMEKGTNMNKKNSVIEKRISCSFGEYEVTGKPDNYSDNVLYDYKTCKAWNIMYPDTLDKWTKQLNIYRYLLIYNGYKVDKITVIAWFKDWKEAYTYKSNDYPKVPLKEYDIKILPLKNVERFIEKRIDKIDRYIIKVLDEDIPICNLTQRWNKYIIMKKGGKRAVRITDDFNEVTKYLNKSSDYYVTNKPENNLRCNKYCNVKEFCNFRGGE